MSYILDALRRADSERERGAIPSLHTKPVPAALANADDETEEGRRTHPLAWAVIALLVAVVALLAWQFLGSGGVPQAAPAPVVVPVPPAATVVPPREPSTPPPQPPSPPVVAQPAPPPAPALAPQASKLVKPAAKQPTAPASAAEDRPVLAFNDLPDNIRRELPQLVIGGAMYSQTPANRMLILNGQVFHEGDKVTGELVLEQIKLKSAVLTYKGYRYGINY
ncbi:MAG TPA: general secretion pathway protein GspB [Rhizobacter sp.]|jgi:general secretion pathway protein B|nr:general secretion pathway protein GspB [Rhizobacter sp.]